MKTMKKNTNHRLTLTQFCKYKVYRRKERHCQAQPKSIDIEWDFE